MASISQLTQVSCSVSLSQPQFISKSSVFAVKSIGSATKSVQKRSISGSGLSSVRSVSRVRATEGEEAVREKEEEEAEKEKEEEAEADKPVAVAEKPKNPSAMDNLKKSLVDAFKGTDRGLLANSETRAKIVELINQLEAKNKVPKDALPLLNGKWILTYTNFAGLFPLLSAGALPLVEVSELSQTIDSENLAVQNSVKLSGPLSSTSLSTNAKFEVQSPKRLQIKYEEGVIRTPQLTESIVFPEYLEILGQKIDLAPLKGILTSVQEASPLKIPIPGDTSQSWLLTTYLDEELRISRGDAGTVFVLVKEGTYFLAP